MNEENHHLLVLSTCPDRATAEHIARITVEEKMAACVNLVPGIESFFHWEGKLDTASEVLLVMKTTMDCYATLEMLVKQHHPCELPEIIAVPIVNGLKDYLNWVSSNTKSS